MVLKRVWHVCKYLSTNCRVIVKLVKVQLTSVCRQAGVFHEKLLTEEVCNWLATTCQLVGEYRFLPRVQFFSWMTLKALSHWTQLTLRSPLKQRTQNLCPADHYALLVLDVHDPRNFKKLYFSNFVSSTRVCFVLCSHV